MKWQVLASRLFINLKLVDYGSSVKQNRSLNRLMRYGINIQGWDAGKWLWTWFAKDGDEIG
jgi:hypothetical protein